MSVQPNLAEQELLADTLRQSDAGLTRGESMVEWGFSLAFVLAAVVLWRVRPPEGFAVVPAGLCAVVMIIATRVRFDTPYGFTVATQLAFVPLMFSMPVAIVPGAVVGCLVLARLPDVLAGRRPPARLVKEIVNSWFAIGPVAVFALAQVSPADAGAALLIAALAAQFAADLLASTLRLALEREAGLLEQLRDSWVYAIDAALSVIGLVVAEELRQNALVALSPLALLALLAFFAQERHQRMRSLIELNDAYRGTALVLGDVVEADDGYTGEHSKGVVALAMAVGQELGLDAQRRRNLEFGALLHDVGKIVIPKEIINKPGKLDPQEWDVMVTHTVEGQKMLDRVGGFMQAVGLIVRSHHERWDGGGYPDGIVGDEIPLEARIISCCDTWNAMRTDRSYRKALSHEAARAELLAVAGHQLDPEIVSVLAAIVDDEAGIRATDLP